MNLNPRPAIFIHSAAPCSTIPSYLVLLRALFLCVCRASVILVDNSDNRRGATDTEVLLWLRYAV